MKLCFLFLIILALALKAEGDGININCPIPESILTTTNLLGDSGYITKKEGLQFLLNHGLTDMTDSFWNVSSDNDTIAKYYLDSLSGNYFCCFIDLSSKYTFETHLLIEINKLGNVLKSERYFHGNYSCCWKSYYEGFSRIGEYYCLKTCGTGSGYCSSYLWIFKDILPQNEQNAIPLNYWSTFSATGQSQNFTSTVEFKNKTLIMHYQLEEGQLDDSSNFNVDAVRRFNVKYKFEKNKWTTKESKKFRNSDTMIEY